MNPRIALLSLSFVFLVPQSAWAHEGHRHEAARPALREESAKARAQQELERLVIAQKIEASWKESGQLKSAEKKEIAAKTWEWLITFENAKAADQSKKVLYIFLKPTGEFMAANFTGK